MGLNWKMIIQSIIAGVAIMGIRELAIKFELIRGKSWLEKLTD